MQKWLESEFGAEALCAQWIRYVDLLGPGWAEIDAFLVGTNCVIACEIKLTQQDHAFYQLESRYVPLLRFIYQRPVCTLQICKYLIEKVPPGRKRTPRELFTNPEPGRFTHHWIGG